MPLADNLALHLKFDVDTAPGIDSGPNAWDMTTNGIVPLTAPPGKVGPFALGIDGAEPFLTRADQTGLLLTDDVFTQEMWVKPVNVGGIQPLWTKRATTGSSASTFEFDVAINGLGQLRIAVLNNAGNSQTLYTLTGAAVAFDAWSHVVIRFSRTGGTGGGYVSVSVNGAAPVVQNFPSAPAVPTVNVSKSLNIGATTAAGTSVLTGDLDCFRIWKRLLSDTEVGWLYNNGNGLLELVDPISTLGPRRLGRGRDLAPSWKLLNWGTSRVLSSPLA